MDPAVSNAEKLTVLLRDREGWRPEPDPELHWCFGVNGAARLVITPEMDGFLMYRADQDRSWVIPRIESVEAWLDQNEYEHAGLTPLQEELKAYLEEGRPGEAGT
jgi:hypothetical protein